jgi:hypothetical protein
MTRSGSQIIAAVILLAATSARGDCLPQGSGEPMKTPPQGSVRAAIATSPANITVGMPFDVGIALCGASSRIERIEIDATMPAHRHGMNYRPTIVAVADGRYQAKGMLFHMPGRWEVVVTVFAGARPERLTLDMDIR